ncbi:hypothetical protein SVIOM342S_08592 [Streptomyces violaceorubidus]
MTVARASRAKIVTVDEAVLLPGPDALLAPEWVPWSERLRPGDMGPGDLLPTDADDLRLEPGWTGEDEPPPNSAVSHEMADLVEAEDAEVDLRAARRAVHRPGPRHDLGGRRGAGPAPYPGAVPVRPARRSRPLGGGLRPQDRDGPGGPRLLCQLRLPRPDRRLARTGVRGLRQRVLPADGHVVSLAYGCGGHSEAAVMPKPPRVAPPVIDETRVDPFPLRPAADSGSVPVSEDQASAELGHS